jgi:hypothetical protein
MNTKLKGLIGAGMVLGLLAAPLSLASNYTLPEGASVTFLSASGQELGSLPVVNGGTFSGSGLSQAPQSAVISFPGGLPVRFQVRVQGNRQVSDLNSLAILQGGHWVSLAAYLEQQGETPAA